MFLLLLVFCGCQKPNPFEFIETKNGQSVFLDASKGTLMYVDESNRIIEQVDLKASAINQNGMGKTEAMSGKEWGTKDIPGTDFKVTFLSIKVCRWSLYDTWWRLL
ncbi:MAG: hypothetical protein LBH32_13275 [Dysgonamonadaceae bacterium]|nr:hypothetical protein [Dysgonamonadaceae bacterium]